ncbi:MAG: PQQ-binding-like beta-propeller repeat protein, partial [Pirellulales bacterium]|nr:PQQ-binding-like beta-propeller repeat protein [Pirellulales bacterium]
MNLRFFTFIALLILPVASPLVAEAQGPRLSPARRGTVQLTETSIESLSNEAAVMRIQLAALLGEREWEGGIDVLLRLIDQFGDDLVETAPGRYHSVAAYCQAVLAELPADALQLYRERVDTAAAEWYEQLRQMSGAEVEESKLLDTFFCSSYGDKALLLLGDRALERGEPDRARDYWQRMHPFLTAEGGVSLWHAFYGTEPEEAAKTFALQRYRSERPPLVYPDTDIETAEIHARLVLASILQKDLVRARWELSAFRQLYPAARGWLRGGEGPYADTLAELIALESSVPTTTQTEWPTFAGASTRNRIFWPTFDFSAIPKWSKRYESMMPAVELPPKSRPPQRPQGQATGAGQQHDLYFYPLIARGLVLLNNSSQIFAFDIESGEAAFEGSHLGQIYPRGKLPKNANREARNRVATDPLLPPQYSMTFFRGRLFARMGTQLTSRPIGFDRGYAGNRILCINLDREGALEWNYPSKQEEPQFDREKWAFEGPPLVDPQGVYVVMRQGAMQAGCYVACLDPATGKLRWRQKVCQANTPGQGNRNEITHTLLTLGQGALYLNTNLGAIASLRTEDGRVRWIHRYSRVASARSSNPPAHWKRVLNPCVYARGVVVAAPRDSSYLLALDANTGQLLWKSAPMNSSPLHLLGIADGTLMAAGDNLWWFNAITGRAEAVWPQPGNRSGPRGYGRGLLAGRWVYWPTRENVYVFDQQTVRNGQRLYPVQRAVIPLVRPDLPAAEQVRGGNLVAGAGVCLIAGRDSLQAF